METSCKILVKESNNWKGDSDSNGRSQLMENCEGVDRRDKEMEEQQDDPLAINININDIPDSIFLDIFSYLPFSSIGNVAQVCQRWWQISIDELLWKEIFLRHYGLPIHTKLPAKADSWRSEFKRLYYHTPCLLSEERKEHRDEVLHVSFSHDGTMFATCSKDGFFKVWECDQPCRLLFEKDMMSSFSWKFTQFSQFNESDTCLLVSGVYFGSLSPSGEIAVFNLQDDFTMQCRVTNKPYDVFGAWYDNDHLLSGTLYWTGDFNSVSAVWLSKASQEVESEMESVSIVLYRFENRNSSSIRLLHVAEVEREDEDSCEHERNGCMEHSPSPCRLLPPAPSEQGQKSLHSPSSSSMKMDNSDESCQARSTLVDIPMGRGIDASSGYNERAAGCDMSLLDKLLKKSIAENEFDIENEDDTDNEECGTEQHCIDCCKNDSKLTSNELEDLSNLDSSATRHNFDHIDGNHPQPFMEDNVDNVDNLLRDVVVSSNVNFTSIGEPTFPLLPSRSDTARYGTASETESGSSGNYSFTSGNAHFESVCGRLKCLEEVDKTSDDLNLNLEEKSKRDVVPSINDSNSSSEGGTTNSNSIGSYSSKELSGGFGTLGINNSNLTWGACDQDDCPMEDEEEETEVESGMNCCDSHILSNMSSVHNAQPSSSKSRVFCDPMDFPQANDTSCQNCKVEMNGSSDYPENSMCPNASCIGSLPLFNVDIKTQSNDNSHRNALSCKELCDCLHVERYGSRPGICEENNSVSLNSHSSNDSTVKNCTSNQKRSINENDHSCDINTNPHTNYDDSISNSTYSNDNGANFCGDEQRANGNDKLCMATEEEEEGTEKSSTLISACSNKKMGNASTQTEESCASLSSSIHSSMAHMSHSMSHSSSLSWEAAPRRTTDKLLIYSWGSDTYIPHMIGIKRIKRSDFCKGEVKARQSSLLLPDVMENLQNVSEDRRDLPDISIDMRGHIVGLSLSPDDRFLYVNCRAWPQNYIISNPQEVPPLAQEVEISTIDLRTFQFVGPILRSHKAYTHSDECFFLNLDVSDDYVVSGAEDKKGYIWDRHYGICLGKFEHRSVVNCMTVCPSDPEVAVSVSDDHTFKVWMSRRKLKEAEKMGKSGNQLTHRNSLVLESFD